MDSAREVVREIAVGTEIDAYRVGARIGIGGMGEVYRASHIASGREVAFKILLPGDDREPGPGESSAEARILQTLDHPSIVKVIDVGRYRGRHYHTMELVLGPYDRPMTLHNYVHLAGGSLDAEDTRRIMLHLLDAIGYAHEHNVVHADIKPDNVLFQFKGDLAEGVEHWHMGLKLGDFGIAKLVGEKRLLYDATVTVQRGSDSGGEAAAALIGTLEYMSPEQRLGIPATKQSDQYSAGLVLFQLLTGQQRPGVRRPSELRAGLDKRWDAIVATALSEAPQDRFESVRAMADAVRATIETPPARELPVATPVSAPTAPVAAAATAPAKVAGGAQQKAKVLRMGTSRSAPHRAPRNSAKPALAAVLLLLLAVGLAGALLLQRRRQAAATSLPAGAPSVSATGTAEAAQLQAALAAANPQQPPLQLRLTIGSAGWQLDLSGNPQLRDLTPLRGRPVADLRLVGAVSLGDLDILTTLPLTSLDLAGCRSLVDICAIGQLRQLARLRLPNHLHNIGCLAAAGLQHLQWTEPGQDFLADTPAADFWVAYRTGPISGQEWRVPGVGMHFEWIPQLAGWLGQCEVSNAEFRLFQPRHDSGDTDEIKRNDDAQPAVNLSQIAAQQFAEWLTDSCRRAGRLPRDWAYQLPTSEAWRRAMSAAAAQQRPPLHRGPAAQPRPVSETWRNQLGLFGAAGNVWEWTTTPLRSGVQLVGGATAGQLGEFLGAREDVAAPFIGHSDVGFRLMLLTGDPPVETVTEPLPRVLPEIKPTRPIISHDWQLPELEMVFVWIGSLDYWVGKYEVTNGEFRVFRPEHDSGAPRGESLNGERQPVVRVSFDDAMAFARWLTERERAAGRLGQELAYRLPTGEEWTALASCGRSRQYPWGSGWPPPQTWNYYGEERPGDWFAKIAGHNDGFTVTCDVERSGANEWQLYGVGGNVWEWTLERKGSRRVTRGASRFNGLREKLRCDYRWPLLPSSREDDTVGFRLILAPPQD